jgi:hypothetical protein
VRLDSDIVTVTPDGRSTVDAKRLFTKPHIREMLREMTAMWRRMQREVNK